VGIENTEDCSFKDLPGSVRNPKRLKNHAKAFSGILIAPLRRPRSLELLRYRINGSARMANLEVSSFPTEFGRLRFSKLKSLRHCCLDSVTYIGRRARSRGEMTLFGNNCSPIVPQQKRTISMNGAFFIQVNYFQIAIQQPGIGGSDRKPTSYIGTSDSGSLESRITTISKSFSSHTCRQVPQLGTSHLGCRKHATKFRESRLELFLLARVTVRKGFTEI
jgi:hypothetical protein